MQRTHIVYLGKCTSKGYFIGITELNHTITIGAYEPGTLMTVEGTYRNAS